MDKNAYSVRNHTLQESADSSASCKQSPGGEIQVALFQVFGARARHHWMQIELNLVWPKKH